MALLFMGIIWAPSLKAAAILAVFGIATEIGGRLAIGITATLERRRAQARDKLRRMQQEGGEADSGAELAPRIHAVRMIPGEGLILLMWRLTN